MFCYVVPRTSFKAKSLDTHTHNTACNNEDRSHRICHLIKGSVCTEQVLECISLSIAFRCIASVMVRLINGFPVDVLVYGDALTLVHIQNRLMYYILLRFNITRT